MQVWIKLTLVHTVCRVLAIITNGYIIRKTLNTMKWSFTFTKASLYKNNIEQHCT